MTIRKPNKYQDLFKGGDRRSIGKSNEVVPLINSQEKFDELIAGLSYADRKVVMRTADAVEKITVRHRGYLEKHKKTILDLCHTASEIELKWHLAQLVSRLKLNKREFDKTWALLTNWAKDNAESKIVRVFSIQALYDLLQRRPGFSRDFTKTISIMEKEEVPSINARIRKLRNAGIPK